jgi:hypothetical protein
MGGRFFLVVKPLLLLLDLDLKDCAEDDADHSDDEPADLLDELGSLPSPGT